MGPGGLDLRHLGARQLRSVTRRGTAVCRSSETVARERDRRRTGSHLDSDRSIRCASCTCRQRPRTRAPVSRKRPYAGMLRPHCRADHSEWRSPSTLRVTRTSAWHRLPQLRPLHFRYRHAPRGTLTISAYVWVCCVVFNGQDDAFFAFLQP